MTSALSVMPVMEIEDAVTRRDQIVRFTKSIMIEGVDYGKVPGTDKNTLLKPGAEKLASFFGLTPVFESLTVIEDWTGQDNGSEPLFYYRYKCKLYRHDQLIGEGIGSCNSRESKYRWRWMPEEDIPPTAPVNLMSRQSVISEFEFAINKAQTSGKYGKPAEYWQEWEAAIKAGEARQITKKTASGKELPAWERVTTVYRVPNEDIFSQVNTLDKMAQKRALIAAVLVTVNASEFFTQDLEDFDYGVVVDGEATVVEEPAQPPQEQPAPKPQQRKPTNGNGRKSAAQVFFDEVQKKTGDYYKNINHLYQTLNEWPDFTDEDERTKALSNAVDHANQ